jgi:outer membrane protein
MKKVLLVFSLLVASLAVANAQTTQGTISLGGSMGVTNTKDEDDGEDTRTSEFRFQPSAGYFVIDNLMVGLGLSVVTGKEDDGFGGDDKYSSFLVGPFARYYIFTSNEKFAFFGEVGTLFGSFKDKPDGQDETKAGTFNLYVSPGFSYFFNEHWGLDLAFQGISFSSFDPDKDEDDDKSTTFNFGVSSFNPSIGIRYYIGN